jgi:excisionase family DNA binding protein
MDNNQSPEPRLMTVRLAAAYLAISERKLWSLTKENRIPAVKIGRAVRYDVADLDSFISESKEGQCLKGTSR